MNILAIETSCDETACSIVKDGITEIAGTVATSAELHYKTGGIVPEVAARKQVESITPVIEDCITKSGLKIPQEIDAVAVTYGPGLIGSLVVGVEAAKALSLAWGKPLIPVNHLIGHIYGNFVGNEAYSEIKFPAVVLIVSGGHTDLVFMKDHGKYKYLGGTVDDAAGEAFDKVARLLGLSRYLGGLELSKLASTCTLNTLHNKLPRPMLNQDNFDFSFSGLKTAVKRLVDAGGAPTETIACEFEAAVVDVLTEKTKRAVLETKAKSVLIGGGVSANTRLRTQMISTANELGVAVHLPPLKYCGDSAAYIASAAFFCGKPQELVNIKSNPSLGVMS